MMHTDLPKIAPIDINLNKQRDYDKMKLLLSKYNYLNRLICSLDVSEDKFKYLLEAWFISEVLTQLKLEPIIKANNPEWLKIMKEKKLYYLSEKKKIERQKVTMEHINIERQLYFTELSLVAGITVNTPNQVDAEYERILELELDYINNSIYSELLCCVNNSIRAFYIKEELKTRSMLKKAITKEDADKIADSKIASYKHIIALLEKKLSILKIKWLEGDKNSLESINMELEMWDLVVEISSKKEFLKRYEDGKNIIP